MTEETKPAVIEKTKKGVEGLWEAVKDNPGHSVVGAIIGTVVIPVPVLGTAVGAAIGGWYGKKNS